MTQAAVSYAVARLEDHMGTGLFLREHWSVRLSEAGARFQGDVSIGLSHIQRSAHDIRSVATGGHVTLSCSTVFAAFRADLPHVELRIHTADRDLDLLAEGSPLAVRGGNTADWPQYQSAPLAAEEIYPVCGTKFLAGRAGKGSGPAVPSTDPSGRTLPLCRDLARIVPCGRDQRTSRAEGAADQRLCSGHPVRHGQARRPLGWRHLVQGIVESGVLVRRTGHRLVAGANFHVIWPRDLAQSNAAQEVCDWLLAQPER